MSESHTNIDDEERLAILPDNYTKDNSKVQIIAKNNDDTQNTVELSKKKIPNDEKEKDELDVDDEKGANTQFLSSNSIDNSHISSSTRKGLFHQLLMTCAVLLLAAACGMPIGYSAVLLPQLYNSTEDVIVDLDMGSWIASIHSAATPIGSFISGPIADRWGRKPALLFAMVPLFLGWSILATACSNLQLLCGRIICGISVGLIAAPCQILLAEIAEPYLRGLLIGAPFVAYSLGILFVYALGAYLHWRYVAWCGTLLPVLAFIAIMVAPESPVWLARHGLLEKCSKALSWLRGGDLPAKRELSVLVKRFENEKNEGDAEEGFFKTLQRISVIKPLVIINLFHILQILSGTYIVVFYAVDIIGEFGGDNINTMTAAVLTAVIRLVFTVVFCFLLLFINRRKMVIYSGLGSGISSLAIAIFAYIKYQQVKTSFDVYLSAIFILIYIGSNTGFLVMPGIMIGELLPAKIRGQIAGYIFTIFNLFLFTIAKIFPFVNQHLKTHGLFLMFAISSLVATVVLYLFMPETKGKTLNEIEDYFANQKWMWIQRNKKAASKNNVTA